MKKSNFEYVAAFARGEKTGFEYFFRELYPALIYYSFRITKDRAIAEDVVSESFIKIWERHDRFNHPQVIKSWLYTTVRNDSINKLQREQRSRQRLETLAHIRMDEYQESPLNGIIIAEVVAEIHKTMQALPAECSKIFRRLYIDGASTREVATELNLSLSTIKSQKARGLSILRKKFLDLAALAAE